MEVNSLGKSKNLRWSLGDTTEIESSNENKSQKNKNHDALVIEYCPKIFKELRNLDDFNAEELFL